MFNVTVITYPHNKKLQAKLGKSLHQIPVHHYKPELMTTKEGVDFPATIESNDRFKKDIVLKGNITLFNEIARNKYHVGYSTF